MKNKHIGSTFESFLDEEGIREEVSLWGAETPSEAQAARCTTDGGARADRSRFRPRTTMVCLWHGGGPSGAGWSGAGGDRGSGAAIPTSPSANPEQIQLTDGVFAPHNHPGLEKVRVWGEYHPELEMTPHLEERMEERDFTEIDVREMLEGATAFAPDVVAGRFVIEALLRGRHWQIIVEPDPDDRLLVVVTAYRPS